MPRRKQDCPKRMKWDGEGEGPSSPRMGEDGSGSEETEENQSPGPPTADATSEPDSAKDHPSPLPSPSKRQRSISPNLIREPSSSPRCPSRDCPSHESANQRCPSRDSLGSAPELLHRPGAARHGQPSPVSPSLRSSPPAVLTPPLVTPSGLVSPVGGAAVGLMGAAAPLMVPPRGIILPLHPSPREAISPLVTTTPSPPHNLMVEASEAVLDFSTKKKKSCSDDGGALNLSKSSQNTSSPSPPATGAGDSPLDLSVPRKRIGGENHGPTAKKSARVEQGSASFKPGSPWGMQFPFFNPNSLSPKSSEIPLWNGKLKLDKSMMSPGHSPYAPAPTNTPSEASKALEKMTELSRLGGDAADIFRNALGAGGRPSAWQTHWLNKGAEQAKDVLKCVWCKQSFPSLAAMTAHMKEAKHCGVSVPNLTPPSSSPAASISSPSTPISSSSHQTQPPNSTPSMSIQAPSTSSKSSPDLNLLIKETMPLPRKLVRGQDVWLGKGAEQTRQILKCMWCGQSFRSLAEMTAHMQQTQHYTNIISQEQIISWRSADDKTNNQSHVSAVLTCKVCDQAFSSLKELSNHMVKNSHYKEHIMRSITESGGRRRQTREKRKKSLPVRKLLELERAQNELKNTDGKSGSKDNTGRITCEKCGDKIETPLFVDHIRQCLGNSQRNLLKSALMSPGADPAESPDSTVKKEPKSEHSDGRPTPPEAASGTTKESSSSKGTNSSHKSTGSGGGTGEGSSGDQEGSPSVLNAIEKLIEKSFDSRARQTFGGTPVGSSILKRLGIDESVDYTKPLVDPQTMNFLRCYQYQQRERSGSESSAMSDKVKGDASAASGSFRSGNGVGTESVTSPAGSTASAPPSSPKSPPQQRQKKDSKPPSEKSTPEMSSPPPPPSLRSTPQPKDNGTHPDPLQDDKSEPKESPPVSPAKESVDGDDKDKSEVEDGKVPDADDRKDAATPVTSPVATSPPASADRVTNGTPTPTKTGSEAPSPCPSTTSDRSDLSCASRSEKKRESPEPTPPAAAASSPGPPPKSSKGKSSSDSAASSLSALSSMFDNLSGAPAEGSSHPLAALQKLCDKTESHASRPGTSGTYASGNQGTPGAILAFSWACNDAVMTDSIMKCAFCDTPFISKGAYRHHLSKMHFVKDGAIPDALAIKNQNPGGKASSTSSSAASAGKSPQPPPPNFEESPHSKFLKYTELAKQLSSKYV